MSDLDIRHIWSDGSLDVIVGDALGWSDGSLVVIVGDALGWSDGSLVAIVGALVVHLVDQTARWL